LNLFIYTEEKRIYTKRQMYRPCKNLYQALTAPRGTPDSLLGPVDLNFGRKDQVYGRKTLVERLLKLLLQRFKLTVERLEMIAQCKEGGFRGCTIFHGLKNVDDFGMWAGTDIVAGDTGNGTGQRA